VIRKLEDSSFFVENSRFVSDVQVRGHYLRPSRRPRAEPSEGSADRRVAPVGALTCSTRTSTLVCYQCSCLPVVGEEDRAAAIGVVAPADRRSVQRAIEVVARALSVCTHKSYPAAANPSTGRVPCPGDCIRRSRRGRMSLAADEVQGDTESALNPFASVWVRFNAKASTAEAAEQKACQTDRIQGTKACRGRKLNIEAGSTGWWTKCLPLAP